MLRRPREHQVQAENRAVGGRIISREHLRGRSSHPANSHALELCGGRPHHRDCACSTDDVRARIRCRLTNRCLAGESQIMLLWRYLNVDAWERLAKDRRLPLSRIAGFEDGFECALPSFVALRRNPTDHKASKSLLASAMRERRSFASCWFADEHESIAMWDLFIGRGEPGVALAVFSEDLRKIVPVRGQFGPVQYARHDDPTATVAVDRPDLWPFYKLWGYRHEREVRLVVPDDPDLVECVADGRWGYLRGTHLLELARTIRVFAPRKSACDAMLEHVRAQAPTTTDVDRSKAYPTMYRRSDDDWWVEGMEPVLEWKHRMG